MSKHLRYVFAVVLAGACAIVVVGAIRAAEPARWKKPGAQEVARLWSPRLPSATDFHEMGGSPHQSPDIAAYSFRVIGVSVEELWKHYAALCGVHDPYNEKAMLIAADRGPNGTYVVSERSAASGNGRRGLSVFMLKSDTYIATVTFQPDAGGNSISGSLSVVVR